MKEKMFAFTVCILLLGFSLETDATTLGNRTLCDPGETWPSNRVNTTDRLIAFRTAMTAIQIQGRSLKGFIVGSADSHNSEYPTEHDQRRQYMTGFGGSAGTAVITDKSAALWVDGRYYLEAEEVLGCDWILMKDGLSDTPTIEDWLNSELTSAGEYVGVDKTLITHTSFTKMSETLLGLSNRHELKDVADTVNFVDTVWNAAGNRPAQPTSNVNALKTAFSGKTWQDKISDLRAVMSSKGVAAYAVTSLDETAWLFNLRGSDIDYNPFFLSYAIVEASRIRLYILNKAARLIASPSDTEATNANLANHLSTSNTGTCTGSATCVEVLDYTQSQVTQDLTTIATAGRVWISYTANYAIYLAVANNRYIEKSPIALVKSQKNSDERDGMTNCYNRDSTTLIKFLAFLEKEIADGNSWSEISAAAELDSRRKTQTYNRGLSFETISSYGSNGAVIHYRPANDTNKVIATDSLYLLDSGGQYLDGTTDVTRTMHYGTPTDYQKECYTRVLASAINLALLKWPEGIYGRQIDAITRRELWDAGLVYRHGTGHGIGSYLSVHEGPGRIALVDTPSASDQPLSSYQYYSDEPGYYEDTSFGIRLETIMMVTPFTPTYKTANENFLTFSAVTLVPFEKNLIDYSRMTSKQVEWLNDYNKKIRDDILPLLTADKLATDWVNTRTEPISLGVTCVGSGEAIYPTAIIFVTTLYFLITALV